MPRILAWTALAAAALIVCPESVWAQAQVQSRVQDGAGMFSDLAVREASAALRDLAKRHGLPIVIETIEALPAGSSIEKAAEQRSAQVGGPSLYVLIADREHKTSPVRVPPAVAGQVKPEQLGLIRESFTPEFRAKRYDEGLKAAVATIGRVLAEARVGGGGPAPETGLISRNQIHLNLSGARVILAAAEARAAELGLKSNIAVVDDGGHPIAFARMDGARPASAYTALTKAATAATTRLPTGPFPIGTTTPDPLLNLSLQIAAQSSGGKFTTLRGGEPIVIDGQVIGAVGAGGGTGEQDAEVCKAGIAALLAEIDRPRP